MLIPFAEKKLIPAGANDPRIKARIGILHVDAGNAESLYSWFNGLSGGIESHTFIKLNGLMEQYRDTSFEADANYLANPFALSVETQGFGAGEWTEEQLVTIKRFMIWCRDNEGIPLRKVESWDDRKGGWGYHTLFGSPSPWTPSVKSCPGPDRIRQFHSILVPWMEAGGQLEPDTGRGPTPNITAALQAKTREERKAALKRVIKHGTDEASQAAMQWLDAIRAIEKAERLFKGARADIKDEEIR